MDPNEPPNVELSAPAELSVTWGGDSHTTVTAHDLRIACPCAGCVNELTEWRPIDPESAPHDLELVNSLLNNCAVAESEQDCRPARSVSQANWRIRRGFATPRGGNPAARRQVSVVQRAVKAELVRRHALDLLFSDRHATGIYTRDHLRHLDDGGEAKGM